MRIKLPTLDSYEDKLYPNQKHSNSKEQLSSTQPCPSIPRIGWYLGTQSGHLRAKMQKTFKEHSETARVCRKALLFFNEFFLTREKGVNGIVAYCLNYMDTFVFPTAASPTWTQLLH